MYTLTPTLSPDCIRETLTSATKSASNSKSSATSAFSNSSAPAPIVYTSFFGSILNNTVRFRTRHHAEIGEYSLRVQRVASRLSQDCDLILSQSSVDLHHLRHRRLSARPLEDVAQST